MRKLILFVLLLVCGCGASLSKSSGPDSTLRHSDIKSIELYISRASYSKTEFEQYKVSNGRIFNECGKVSGGRQTSELQNLVKLEEKDQSELNTLTTDIISFNKEHELELDKPGASSSMFDSGQFLLKIKYLNSAQGTETIEIKTSLEGIISASKTSEENLKKLAKKLRSIALINSNQSLCGNHKFYEL